MYLYKRDLLRTIKLYIKIYFIYFIYFTTNLSSLRELFNYLRTLHVNYLDCKLIILL